MKNIYSLLIAFICVFAANAQVLDRSQRPEAAPAKEINIKDAQIFTLKNGLKVFLVQDKTTPLVYYSLQLDVKPALQGDKAGMFDMFNDVFGQITTNRTKEQLNKEQDLIAMRGGVHRGGGYAYFLKKYHDKALDIMTDMLFNPVFSQEEFDLSLKNYKTNLTSLGDDGGQINNRVSDALTFGKGFPAGQVETNETLDNISLSDLEGYYNTYFAPNVSRLVIVGDISLKEAKKITKKYFGKWAKKDVPVTEYVIPKAPAARKVAFVNKPGAVQSSIDVSYPVDFRLGTYDYDAALIMSDILGGSGTGHLFMNLRETHSWTYGVYSSLAQGELTGRFNITAGRGSAASVKAIATDSAVFEILAEMNRIINEPVTEDELEKAKTYRIGNFSRSLEDSETIAQFAVNIDKYNLPKDYYKNYLKRVEAITPADIKAAARHYIKPNNAWIVVTADREHADALARFAPDKKVQWYDYDANPVEAPKYKVSDLTAEQVVAGYINAIGGKEAIENIKDYTQIASMSMMGQDVEVKQVIKTPHMSLTEMVMSGMTIQRLAFDGKMLRISGMQGNQDVDDPAVIASMKEQAEVCPEANFLNNGYTLTVEGIDNLNGKDAYVLKVEKNGAKQTIYFDKESGLKVRTLAEQEGVAVSADYSDYREVNGIKFPFMIKQTQANMPMDMVVKSISINQNVDASLFK